MDRHVRIDRALRPVRSRPFDHALCAPRRPAKLLPSLAEGSWAADNHARLSTWLEGLGHAADTRRPRTAAFDWDGTSVIGDSGVFCWHYMVDQFLIQVQPDKLEAVLCWPDVAHYPAAQFDYVAHLRADILAAYATLWSLRHDRAAASTAPARLDFRAKLGAYCAFYDRVTPPSLAEGPLWMKWFTGFLPREIGKLATEAAADASATVLTERCWSSTATGQAGQVHYTFSAGLVRRAEMFDLMQALDARGVAVCIVTGGIEPMVRALAQHMGAPVLRQHVIGIRYHRDMAGRLLPDFLPDAHRPISYGPGKTSCIRRFLPGAPILVAGDTGGDLHMLQDFAETQMRLIVANALRGPLLALVQASARPKTVLQAVSAVDGGFAPHAVDLAQASQLAAAFGALHAAPAPCTETAAASAIVRSDAIQNLSSSEGCL